MCYHVKFGSSAIKGVHINGKEPKQLENSGTPPLGTQAWLTLLETFLGRWGPASLG